MLIKQTLAYYITRDVNEVSNIWVHGQVTNANLKTSTQRNLINVSKWKLT